MVQNVSLEIIFRGLFLQQNAEYKNDLGPVL